MIHEDFVPLSDTEALVSRGESLTSLTEIARVPYVVTNGRVRLAGDGVRLVAGIHLRLGNSLNGILCYSHCPGGLHGTPDTSSTGIQPWVDESGNCYWNEPLAHGDCPAGAPQGIYRNGEIFLKHWNGGVVGKPMVDDGWLYFEAREPDAKMPQGWEIWRMNLETREREFIRIGANPCMFNGRLFFTDFSQYPKFHTCINDNFG